MFHGMAPAMDRPKNQAVAALDDLVNALHARGRLRIWSLIVTIFGDAIVPRDGKVGLSTLQVIMDRLGIENGALRTAMSRLAADGWVVREKSGRNSIYALAGSGRQTFDEATRRIYAAGPPEWDGSWTVAVAPVSIGETEAARLMDAGFVEAGSNCWLRPDTADSQLLPENLANVLVLTSNATAMPNHFGSLWQLDEIGHAFREVTERFLPLQEALSRGETLAPLDAMAARSLLIHDWRRVALQSPVLPSELLPEAWPGVRALWVVRSTYAKLGAASEQWLNEAGLPPQTDPTRFATRFGIFQSSR